MVYAVIDTNVLVSALFSAHTDSSTVIIRDKIADGEIVPLLNPEIIDETAMHRNKKKLPSGDRRESYVLRLMVIRRRGE